LGQRLVADPIEYWARNLWRGVLGSQAGAYDFAGNLAGLANKATEAMGGEVAFPDLPQRAHEYAQRIVDYAPKLEEVDEHFVGRGLEGLGAAPQAIAEYATASKALRSGTAGFAALDAAREANKGWKEALLAGVKGALLGKAFEGTAGLSRTAKVPALGVLGGTMAATEGGDVKDIAVGATTLGALGAMHGGPVGPRQAGRRFAESFKAPEPIPVIPRQEPYLGRPSQEAEPAPEPVLPAAPITKPSPPEGAVAPVEAPAAYQVPDAARDILVDLENDIGPTYGQQPASATAKRDATKILTGAADLTPLRLKYQGAEERGLVQGGPTDTGRRIASKDRRDIAKALRLIT
ncbi:hypothetical protein LCGC14_3088720, partial [marine sediment metagenome]